MEILLSGELIDAEEALRYGFINRVVPQAEVLAEAERWATIISKKLVRPV